MMTRFLLSIKGINKEKMIIGRTFLNANILV